MFKTCSRHVQNMFKTCSRHVHNMFTTCSQHVYNIFTTCSQHVHNMFTTCSQHVHNIFIKPCSSFVHHILITCSSHIHHMFITCSSHVHPMVTTSLKDLSQRWHNPNIFSGISEWQVLKIICFSHVFLFKEALQNIYVTKQVVLSFSIKARQTTCLYILEEHYTNLNKNNQSCPI